jgi:phage protein D
VSTYQVILDGSPAKDGFYDVLAKLEVEENADLPDALSLQLPVAAAHGELTWVGNDRIGPYANIAVVVTPDGGDPQCIFDGYVLSNRVHMPAGPADATVDVWGQDASVLMGLEEKVREWSGMTDAAVANQIFGSYHGVTPAPDNTREVTPVHAEDEHTLMQRGSDIAFLRRLARRTGRWCRVLGTGTTGQRVGYFALPSLTAAPAITINLNDPAKSSVPVLDFSWDIARPTSVLARQASLTDADRNGVGADTADSGLPALDARALEDFAGRRSSMILTAAADTAELPGRARSVLREAGWFARCEGTADIAVLKQVLRVGSVVAVEGVGALLSGAYLVWSVRHTITTQDHAMAFVLVRNAVGPAPASGSHHLPKGPGMPGCGCGGGCDE